MGLNKMSRIKIIYMPKENVDMVLEVNGGFSDSQRIKIGDIVELR